MSTIIKFSIPKFVILTIFLALPVDTADSQENCIDDFDVNDIQQWHDSIAQGLNASISEVGVNPTSDARQWIFDSLVRGLRYENKLVSIGEIESTTIKPLAAYVAKVAGSDELTLEQAQHLVNIFRACQIAGYSISELPTQISEMVGVRNSAIYSHLQDQTAEALKSGLWKSAVSAMNAETLGIIEVAVAEQGAAGGQAVEAMQFARLFPSYVDVNVCSIPPGAQVYLVPEGRSLGVTTIEGEVFEAGRTYRLRFELGGCQALVRDYPVPYQKDDYDILELLQCAGG